MLTKKLSLDVENRKKQIKRKKYVEEVCKIKLSYFLTLQKKKKRKENQGFKFTPPEKMVREYQRKQSTDHRLEYYIDNPKIDSKVALDMKNLETQGRNLLLVIRVQSYELPSEFI